MSTDNLKKAYLLINKEYKKIKTNNVIDTLECIKIYIFFIGIMLIEIKLNKELSEMEAKLRIKKINIIVNKKFSEYNKPIFSNEESNNIKSIINNLSLSEINEFDIAFLYQKITSIKQKKNLGQVYTPKDVIKDMVEIGIKDYHIINDPYYKVIDPSCGGGYFLLEVHKKIKNILINNKKEVLDKHPNLKSIIYNDIDKFITFNNIYGVDIDNFSIFITYVSFVLKFNTIYTLNLYTKDILIDRNDNIDYKFDLVIGNPPYIGHKKIESKYKRNLKKYYSEVYSDKADISYCFFMRGFELLKNGGTLLFITSRYFMEASCAVNLRKYLVEKFNIDIIIDYYGFNVFKGVGISPVIIKLNTNEEKQTITNIYRWDSNNIKDKEVLFNKFQINNNDLHSDGWIFLNHDERILHNKIHSKGNYYLKDVCFFYQGIISGYDKAFILNEDDIYLKNLEEDIIKPWVKNSNIDKYKDIFISKYILYTNIIDDYHKYKNSIKHISKFKDKLSRRRECKKNIRKWYELQWCRNLDIFNSPKIIFPYKAENSKFTIDNNNILCSADVYIINTKNKYKSILSLEYLLAFLNSSLFEFYYKSVAKKVGASLYEYYPNKIKNMKIKVDNIKYIEKSAINIINYYKELDKLDNKKTNKYIEIHENIKKEKKNIDDFFYKTYGLNDKEKDIVNNYYKCN